MRVTFAFRDAARASLVCGAVLKSGFLPDADRVLADAADVWWVLWPDRRMGGVTAAATAARQRARTAVRRRGASPGGSVVSPRSEMAGAASAAASAGRRVMSCRARGSVTSVSASQSSRESRSSSARQEGSSERRTSGARGAACRTGVVPSFPAPASWAGRSRGSSLPFCSARPRPKRRPSAWPRRWRTPGGDVAGS